MNLTKLKESMREDDDKKNTSNMQKNGKKMSKIIISIVEEHYPGFNADNNMYRNLTFAIVIAVVNVIDPPEMLTPSPPYRPTLVTALQRTQRFNFFPHRRQTFVAELSYT